jgi:thiamine thiazole synthase
MSKLLARPNVKLFNAVAAEDLIVKSGRVGGVIHTYMHAYIHIYTKN